MESVDLFRYFQLALALAVFSVYGARWLTRKNGESVGDAMVQVLRVVSAVSVLPVGCVLVYSAHDPDALDILKEGFGEFTTFITGLAAVFYALYTMRESWPK